MREKYIKKGKNDFTMLRPTVPIKKMYWEFHKGDNDNLPSVTHGHSLDGKYKLEIWNGKIYNIQSGKVEYIAKKKDMKALQQHPGFIEFVKECREEYKERNPDIVLPELITVKNKRKKYCGHKKLQEKKFILGIRMNKV